MTRHDMSEQRAALSAAVQMRAEHVRAIAEGILDPFDVIDAARSRAGIPLRHLHVELLLRAVQDPRPMRWPAIRARFFGALGDEVHDNKLDIGWVLDVRRVDAATTPYARLVGQWTASRGTAFRGCQGKHDHGSRAPSPDAEPVAMDLG